MLPFGLSIPDWEKLSCPCAHQPPSLSNKPDLDTPASLPLPGMYSPLTSWLKDWGSSTPEPDCLELLPCSVVGEVALRWAEQEKVASLR